MLCVMELHEIYIDGLEIGIVSRGGIGVDLHISGTHLHISGTHLHISGAHLHITGMISRLTL